MFEFGWRINYKVTITRELKELTELKYYINQLVNSNRIKPKKNYLTINNIDNGCITYLHNINI